MNGRSFEFELTEEYKRIFAPLVELLKNNEDKYFVAFRTQPNRMTIYYKGQELISIKYKNGVWYAFSRTVSSTKVEANLLKANEIFLADLAANDFLYREEMLIDDKFDLLKFLKINEEWIDSFVKYYVSTKNDEKRIQSGISSKYSYEKAGLVCVDTEYMLSDSMRNSKKINGRYDFLFLKKNDNNKFEIVPAELKSKKSACVKKPGIIDHFEDMLCFKNEYNNVPQFRERIKEDIVTYLNMKNKFGLLEINITMNDIEDVINEFWMLFKMIKGELKNEPHFKYKYHELIEEEFNNDKVLASEKSLNEILEKIDTQKAYYLTDDYEFKEI